MRLMDRVYLNLAKVLPGSYRNVIRRQLMYAGVKDKDENVLIGATTLLAVLCPVIAALVPVALQIPIAWWHVAIGVALAVIIEMVFYLVVYFRAMDRARRAEDALPDALHMISSNLKAGMTPFNALKATQRKELGPLAEEIGYATQRAFGTESFSSVLLRIGERLNSDIIMRTLRLFTTSLQAGGHSAQLLQELARDISETRQLKKEFMAATKTYSMFIFFTVVIGAPFLVNIAIQFVNMITKISSKTKLGSSSAIGGGLFSGSLPVSVDFLFWLSVCMLVTTSILASMLMSVIKEGRIKDGLRSAPLIAGGAIIVFLISKQIMASMF